MGKALRSRFAQELDSARSGIPFCPTFLENMRSPQQAKTEGRNLQSPAPGPVVPRSPKVPPTPTPINVTSDAPIKVSGDAPIGLTAEELAVVMEMRRRAAAERVRTDQIAVSIARDIRSVPAATTDATPDLSELSTPPSTPPRPTGSEEVVAAKPPAIAADPEVLPCDCGEGPERLVTLYKEKQSQLVGIRFFAQEEARRRGVTDDKAAIVAMVAPGGPMDGLASRGDRIATVSGVPMESPTQAAIALRTSDGYTLIGVLPPCQQIDLSLESTEVMPIVTPRAELFDFSSMGATYAGFTADFSAGDTSSTTCVSPMVASMMAMTGGDSTSEGPSQSGSSSSKAVSTASTKPDNDKGRKPAGSQPRTFLRWLSPTRGA